jgi:hypothetical protein
VFEITSEGIARATQDLEDNPDHGGLIEIASRGVPSLVISCVYMPLGLPAPNYKLTHRPGDDSEAWVVRDRATDGPRRPRLCAFVGGRAPQRLAQSWRRFWPSWRVANQTSIAS